MGVRLGLHPYSLCDTTRWGKLFDAAGNGELERAAYYRLHLNLLCTPLPPL